MPIPRGEIERTIAAYPSGIHQRLLPKLLKLANEKRSRHMGQAGVLAAIGEERLGLGAFARHLADMRTAALNDDPPLSVGIVLPGWRPELKWFAGPFPDDSQAAHAFGLKAGEEYSASENQNLPIWKVLATAAAFLSAEDLTASLLEGFWSSRPAGATNSLGLRSQPHRDILNLLEHRLPRNPVHLPELALADLASIYQVRNYAYLLDGIRLSESSFTAAEEHLSAVENRDPAFNECPLRHLAVGIAQRKQDGAAELVRALQTLEHGLAVLEKLGDSEYCTHCKVSCSRPVLELEHYRCVGAAKRKLHQIEPQAGHLGAAREAFLRGEQLLDPKMPNVISDFFFSYGYLEYEDAFARNLEGEALRAALVNAKEKLELAHKANKTFGAPCLRIGIIKVALGEAGLGTEFAAGEVLTSGKSGADAALTRMLSIMSHRLVTGNNTDDGQKVLAALRELFDSVFLPRGPRECHAFDASIVFQYGERGIQDPALRKAFQVMIASGTWGECRTLAEQRNHTDASLSAIDEANGGTTAAHA